jgi:hypothetical protein
MDQKLIACGDFSLILETMVIMKKPIVPVTAMVDHVWGLSWESPPPDLLINVKVNEFDGFSLFIQETDSIEAVIANLWHARCPVAWTRSLLLAAIFVLSL